ncbi:MAG: lamin tail domain-containing protein, partial [Phycisphaerales bacterium]
MQVPMRVPAAVLLAAFFLAGYGAAQCPESDLSGDCEIGFEDMSVLAEQWLSPPGSPADLDGLNGVEGRDFALLARHWEQAGIPLVINEVLAANSTTVRDPQYEYDDWVEIYNHGSEAIDVGGMYLTDNLDEPTKWRIPAGSPGLTTIDSGWYLLIWADGDVNDSPGLHASFRLDAGGDEVGLFDSDGVTLVDSVEFGEQTADISYGRYPDGSDTFRFMVFPSAQGGNLGVYLGFVEDLEFSHEHGYYDSPFQVTIACETEQALIFYTLDGSEPVHPVTGSPTGIPYAGPISIGATTCLRAQAIKQGWRPSRVATSTYIFLADVVRQSPYGQPPAGSGWPSGSVNGQVIDYGMDPDIINSPAYASLMDDALVAVPTISLVTDLDNLFDSSKGIYVNARRQGRSWERPTSVELIYPDGLEGFQVDAGLRIRGGYSRSGSNPKHAFRLFFRAEYGAPHLKYKMFGDEGVDEFDNLDLRTAQNYSWSYGGDSSNTMAREVFSRDTQRDMQRPYTRSRYYHLYINGQYWGIFQTQERSEASYCESYFGGDKEDYDVVKSRGGNPDYILEATDGSLDAWRRIWDATNVGFTDDESYYGIQGLNTDGTVNPAYEKLLDIDNLIDYMICTYYVGDPDGPVSAWARVPNNFYAIYNRNNPDGFKFFRHDGEHSLRNLNENRLFAATTIAVGSQFYQSNPLWFHTHLIEHPEYRMRFADRVHKHFFNDGVLVPSACIARFTARTDTIDLAIIAESARWGDAKRSSPRTRNGDWLPEITGIINSYLPNRTGVVLNQFKSQGWYPNVEAPIFNPHGGFVPAGFGLTMSNPNGTGVVYYTLTGSDPRVAAKSEITTTTLAEEDADKRVLVPASAVSDNWRGAAPFDDSTWSLCAGAPGGVGFDTRPDYDRFITLDVEQQMRNKYTGCYVRVPFSVDAGDLADFNFMTLAVNYDDGFVAYINGVEVERVLFTGTPAWNSRADGNHEGGAPESFDISEHISALQPGGNILAVHALNVSTSSSDFLISVELTAGEKKLIGEFLSPDAVEYAGPVTLAQSGPVRSRVFRGGEWSALNEAVYSVGPVAENLRITEIMYHPYDVNDPNDPNEEYIELTNIGAGSINLNLVRFTNGIDFVFPPVELGPGQYVLVVQDRDAFEARYGTGAAIAGQYAGRLNNGGERIRLEDAIGGTILDFKYKDGWRAIADGYGYSLTITDAANPDPNSWGRKDSWRASAYEGGSPGEDDGGIIPNPGSVVINEIMAHSHADAPDWVELYNTTDAEIDIGGWYLSD